MFGKKKEKPQIDQNQLELIQNAQRRIKQKRRLLVHFILFLIGALCFVVANTVLKIGVEITFFGTEWFVYAILTWLVLLLYHTLNVFVINRFMGKSWEKEQLDKLMVKQKIRIEKLKSELKKEDIHIAQTDVYNKHLNSKEQNITLIVAAAENDAIGKDNKLIWHLRDDLKRFKKLTSGHHIIMGRKTFESFPKPLPNRTHVVITRQENYNVPEGVIIVNSLDDAIKASKSDQQPYIIGGGEIYKQAIEIANTIELTRVHESFEADTFFPKIDNTIWDETANTFHTKDDIHKHEFSFLTYKKK